MSLDLNSFRAGRYRGFFPLCISIFSPPWIEGAVHRIVFQVIHAFIPMQSVVHLDVDDIGVHAGRDTLFTGPHGSVDGV